MSYYNSHINKLGNSELSNTKLVELIKGRVWNSKQFKFKSINDKIDHVPTMLTLEEKKMLNWIARYYVNGVGAVVDLGAFLGGSTVQLANGLSNNINKKNLQLHSYDRFEFTEEYKEKWLYERGVDKFEGTDVLFLVEDMLKDYKDVVNFRKGDFVKEKWDDGPIEVLFVDIAKTWELTDVITNEFFTNLIPGKSIVIQQDMLFFNCPWVSAVMFRLREHFEFLSGTEYNSAIFLNTEKVSEKTAEWASSSKFTPRDVINGLDFFIDKMNYFPHKEALQKCKKRFVDNPKAVKAWQL